MQLMRLFRGNDLKLRILLPVRLPSHRFIGSSYARFADKLESCDDKSSDASSNPCANDSVKVTVIGAAGRVGRILSLLVKTNPLVDHLCMFDIDKSVKGLSVDISHIDTKCRVSYACGMGSIEEALDNPDVVLIAAGSPTSHLQGTKLFKKNAPIVAGLSEACARCCPEACLVLITNPINSLLPVAGEVYTLVTGKKQNDKLFGLTTLDVVRANTFTAEAIRHDPNNVIVPVIGGTSEETIVPVISQMKPCCKIKHDEVVALTECVKQAECSLKDCQNCGTRGSSTLSTAYAAFRFSSSLISALKGKENIVECAYVQSDILPELEYLASPLKLGKCGIEYNYGYPNLSEYEVSLMERAAPALQNAIKMGKAFAIEQRGKHHKKRCKISETDSTEGIFPTASHGPSPLVKDKSNTFGIFEPLKSKAYAVKGRESECSVKFNVNRKMANHKGSRTSMFSNMTKSENSSQIRMKQSSLKSESRIIRDTPYDVMSLKPWKGDNKKRGTIMKN